MRVASSSSGTPRPAAGRPASVPAWPALRKQRRRGSPRRLPPSCAARSRPSRRAFREEQGERPAARAGGAPAVATQRRRDRSSLRSHCPGRQPCPRPQIGGPMGGREAELRPQSAHECSAERDGGAADGRSVSVARAAAGRAARNGMRRARLREVLSGSALTSTRGSARSEPAASNARMRGPRAARVLTSCPRRRARLPEP